MIFSIRVASRARREKRHTPRRFPDRDWDRPISVPRRFRPCFPFRRRLTPKSPVYIHLCLNRAGDIKRGAVQKENIIDSAPGRLSPTGKDTEERRCAYGLTRLRTMPGQWRQSGLTATGLSDLPDSIRKRIFGLPESTAERHGRQNSSSPRKATKAGNIRKPGSQVIRMPATGLRRRSLFRFRRVVPGDPADLVENQRIHLLERPAPAPRRRTYGPPTGRDRRRSPFYNRTAGSSPV